VAGCERQPADAAGLEAPPEDLVAKTAQGVRPLLIGAKVPELELRTSEGKPLDLNVALAEKPTALVFYRGGWCMYCNMHFGQLKKVEQDILEDGWQIVAVSPDRPERLRETVEKHEPAYTVASDSDMDAARAFGLAFQLDEQTLDNYAEYGIDVEDASGRSHHLLPVPAVFLINTDGVITFQYVNPDYKTRLHPQVLLAAVKTSE
jgi:peroxiredoxin